MSSTSPWSREAVIRLASEGHKIHVIDPSVRDRHTYIAADDPSQAIDIQSFSRSISAIDRMQSSLPKNSRYVGASWELSRILKKQNCDLLVALYGGRFATMAYLCGFRPYVVYVVGSDVLFGGRAKKLMSRLSLSAASAVMVNGQYLTEKTRELAPQANAQCLYLGTDVEKFIPVKRPSTPIRVVCTRGFSEIYNNEYLIRALKEMPSLTEPFHLTFAAPGPLLDKVRAVADQILPTNVRRSVEFLAGVGRDRMAELLRNAHIYVSVSRSDGTSLSLMEGLACGLFPVVSDIPANREWISNTADNGILVPLNDPATLAAALVRAISEPALRAKAAAKNRELVLQRADSRKNMATFASNLQKIALGQEWTIHTHA